MSTEKIMSMLRLKKLERIGEPVLKFRTLPETKNKLPLGSSKLGGNPDLPVGISWPVNDGRPLDLLVQLDLAELPKRFVEGALPERGWLYFFYDLKQRPWGFDVSHRHGWRVLFYDGDRKILGRRSRPDATHPVLGPCGLTFFEGIYVNWPSLEDEKSRSDLHSLTKEGLFQAQVENSGHQILGRTHGCQSMYEEMQEECQLVSNGIYLGGGGGPVFDHVKAEQFKPGTKDWRLLLELGSDENASLEWTGYGTLYFWIREDDLLNCDFHNVWAVFQCT
jgi:uncharacterized protein YwqG